MPVQARFKSSAGVRIGELAARLGVHASTLRYYEHAGLLPPPPRRAGRREYGVAEAELAALLVAARRLGFAISDLKPPNAGLRNAARRLSQDKREAAKRLLAQADRLDVLATCCCTKPADCVLLAGEHQT